MKELFDCAVPQSLWMNFVGVEIMKTAWNKWFARWALERSRQSHSSGTFLRCHRLDDNRAVCECVCGVSYTRDEWPALPRIGLVDADRDDAEDTRVVELRLCPRCRKTLAVRIPIAAEACGDAKSER
jgi:hypothetical protein